MLKITLTALALGLAGAAVAQTTEPATPAPPEEPAQPATPPMNPQGPEPATPATPAEPTTPPTTTGAGIAATELPRCSAEVRDRCIQDERFASDRFVPGRSRDNNAMHYRTSRQAETRSRRPTR